MTTQTTRQLAVVLVLDLPEGVTVTQDDLEALRLRFSEDLSSCPLEVAPGPEGVTGVAVQVFAGLLDDERWGSFSCALDECLLDGDDAE